MTQSDFDSLYSDLQSPVLRLCYRSTKGNGELAEELSQQVWLKVWRYRETQADDLEDWVYSIARSVVAGHFRKERSRRTQSTDWQEIELADDQADRNAGLQEENDRLARLREVLPPELHPMLDAWLTGKSDIEIGQATGLPAGSVAYHKNRVRDYASRIG